mmetsp:Transcript_8855/g.14607  ORF Transcript_8855/g.14607 Transcript_8855/m.14607 type:complete len:88 (-) Transcript_8855:173-436(-)
MCVFVVVPPSRIPGFLFLFLRECEYNSLPASKSCGSEYDHMTTQVLMSSATSTEESPSLKPEDGAPFLNDRRTELLLGAKSSFLTSG